ncbi:hypothetical protein D1007_61187 [Hordeum vulgare]|nr:hypothetical protein D1007_61187 [Hordeum vulgare]
MRGIFVNFSGNLSGNGRNRPYFFYRGSTVNPSIAIDPGALDFMRHLCCDYARHATILDHRNGLLLYRNGVQMFVGNPATCRWAKLPATNPFGLWSAAYLVFDPVVSLHYNMLIFRNKGGKGKTPPPSSYMVQVYSSRTDQWEEWPFIREGDATMITMWSDQLGDPKRRGDVYWRGALYLHCCSGLLIRQEDLSSYQNPRENNDA